MTVKSKGRFPCFASLVWFMRIFAIDIGGTAIKYGVVNGDYTVEQAFETPTEAHLGGAHLPKKLMALIDRFADTVDCIGISTAGQVDSVSGRILHACATIPDYTGVELQKPLLERYGLPVCVENDVNCAATAEARFGAGRGFRDFLCLTYGTGIGGALWLQDRLYTGSRFSAGEFGHIVTHKDGRNCTCGGNGCYEMYASTVALQNDVQKATGKQLSGRAIFAPEHFGDETIRRVIDNWIDEVVCGLSSLIYIFNPPCIVLGGGIMREDYVVSEITRRLRTYPVHSFQSVAIRKAALGNQAGMLGAAFLAKQAAEARA